MTSTISPEELAKRKLSGKSIELIDVRTPVEFREVHVDFAKNIPLAELDAAKVVAQRGETSEPLYVICRSGNRAGQACEKLAAAGIPVVNVEGGTTAWDAAGLPVVRGKKAMSLERQVRIVIGCMVLMASALGYFVHPYWIGLVAFLGGGLVFSGITDFCGLALILGRMPWNQVSGGATCARPAGQVAAPHS